MIDANLIINNAAYTNDSAIENTINYIYRLDNVYKYYYGIWPPTPESAIALFNQTRETFPQNTCDQQIVHLIISFKTLRDIELINKFSDQIALLFSQQYPVCFALHDDEKHLHTHFIISSTSYIPNAAPLTNVSLKYFIPQMEHIAYTYNISFKKVTKNV